MTKGDLVGLWREVLSIGEASGLDDISDAEDRIIPIRLSGKDRVRWWSGWFHYPLLIEDCRRQLAASTERLQVLIQEGAWHRRSVVEEAY